MWSQVMKEKVTHMADNHLRIAELDDEQRRQLQALEQELSAQILALEPKVSLRDLSPAQLRRLKAVEEQLGVVLLAYEPSA